METTRIEKRGTRTWTVVNEDGESLSTLMLTPDGEVEWIGTLPRYRRKGYARALWEHVKAQGITPRHSDSRSREGTAWALAVGGDLPPLASCGYLW